MLYVFVSLLYNFLSHTIQSILLAPVDESAIFILPQSTLPPMLYTNQSSTNASFDSIDNIYQNR